MPIVLIAGNIILVCLIDVKLVYWVFDMEFIKYVRSGLLYRYRKIRDFVVYPIHRLLLPARVRHLRAKESIRVGFVLTNLGVWKTESLFRRMLEHPRFEPICIVIPSQWEESMLSYVKDKHYPYLQMVGKMTIAKDVNPDLLFYQKPYDATIPNRYNFRRVPKALLCYDYYAFHHINEKWTMNAPIQLFAWQQYFENKLTLNDYVAHSLNRAVNGLVTGLSMTDEYLLSLSEYSNPWKNHDGRKRIIYAPHHSVGDFDHKGIYYSTFLEYADFMLQLAKRYNNSVYFAFKPHPLLRDNLKPYWSQERIDSYYSAWKNLENAQYENGRYVELFMHSDAMIHDCGSFTIEYHYSHKPVMYLVRDDNHDNNQNDFGKRAFHLHYIGHRQEDIETFVKNVIEGRDELIEERQIFYNEMLLPPNGKSSSENIINAILDES